MYSLLQIIFAILNSLDITSQGSRQRQQLVSRCRQEMKRMAGIKEPKILCLVQIGTGEKNVGVVDRLQVLQPLLGYAEVLEFIK